MRKDRNTFFSESNMFQSNFPQQQMANPGMISPGMGNPGMIYPAPYQQSSASNSFYQGAIPNQGMAPGMMPTGVPPLNSGTPNSDYENRLAKMERQIRRLETRINKLESHYGTSSGINEEIDTNISSNMYMI